jgi:hypothetical protein
VFLFVNFSVFSVIFNFEFFLLQLPFCFFMSFCFIILQKNLQRQEVTAENCLMEDIKHTKITRTNCKPEDIATKDIKETYPSHLKNKDVKKQLSFLQFSFSGILICFSKFFSLASLLFHFLSFLPDLNNVSTSD